MEVNNENNQTNDTVCCDVLEKMNIGWMRLSDNEKIMPYIKGCDDEMLYRINYCPSCGKNIRGIILKKTVMEYADIHVKAIKRQSAVVHGGLVTTIQPSYEEEDAPNW